MKSLSEKIDDLCKLYDIQQEFWDEITKIEKEAVMRLKEIEDLMARNIKIVLNQNVKRNKSQMISVILNEVLIHQKRKNEIFGEKLSK